MQWKYRGKTDSGWVEVMTMINFDLKKGKYAFYSFNPFDPEPLPHYGNWISPGQLRLNIFTPGEKTIIDFMIRENGGFNQIHSRISDSGEVVPRLKTVYIRKK